MTKRYWIREDKLPSRLFVTFSSMISNRIDSISVYNCNNTESLSQWYDYIDGIKRYVSNPTIALDYMGRYPQFPNGAKFIKDFDYNIEGIPLRLTIRLRKHMSMYL